MSFTADQRILIADKLMDTGNYAIVTLVFGQLATGAINPLLLLLGVTFYAWCWTTALHFRREAKRK